MWRNSESGYGLITISLHWVVAIAVIGLFTLGLWMVGLDYYDRWYRKGPELHKGIGVLLFLVMLGRTAWRHANPRPAPTGSNFEKRAARWVHSALYVLLFILMLSGYLISTADGRGIKVFGLFAVPASFSGGQIQADVAGKVHEWLAYLLIALATLHALAALKHHLVDRDETLTRMLGTRR